MWIFVSSITSLVDGYQDAKINRVYWV